MAGFLCAAAMVAAASATGQTRTGGGSNDLAELSLEDLMAVKVASVSTPSRYAQKTENAPASVTVITSEEIKLFGYRTLADILESMPGMYVTYDRNYAYLGVRGFSIPSDYNSRVLVLVDGHRINENIYGGGLLGGEFVLDVDLIDRVEVVHGPASSMYGSSALLAVVNVFTKKARDLQHAEASVSGGSFDTLKERGTIAGVATNAGIEYVLSATYYDSAGPERLYFKEFDSPATHNGIAEDLDYERSKDFYARITWSDFTLSSAWVLRKKGVPTASWSDLFDDPRYYTVDTRGYIDLSWRHSLDEDSELMARAYYDDYQFVANYPNAPPQPPGLSREDDVGRLAGGEVQYTRRWHDHTLTLGAEARDHFQQDQSYYYVSPPEPVSDNNANSFDFGAYAQDEFTICTNLILNAGLRWDHYESFGDTVNPRVGLIHHPWKDATIKMLYGSAYRAPTTYELHSQGGGNMANPNLKPERIQTYEVVCEQTMPGNLCLSLSAYHYDIEDLIVQSGDTEWTFNNAGRARADGAEVELNWKHRSGVQARASYSHQLAIDEQTNKQLPESPEHLAKLNLIVPLYRDRVFSGAEVLYTGGMKTLPESETRHVEGYWLANWTLFSQRIVKNVELSASIYNLFDAHYAVPAGVGFVQDEIWQDGRTFRVKMTYRF